MVPNVCTGEILSELFFLLHVQLPCITVTDKYTGDVFHAENNYSSNSMDLRGIQNDKPGIGD